MEMTGSRPMTPSERQWRSRSLRALHAAAPREAEDEAITQAFIGSYRDPKISVPVADFILAGRIGENEPARRTIAAFLAGLPGELSELRRDLDEIRETAPAAPAGARSRPAG